MLPQPPCPQIIIMLRHQCSKADRASNLNQSSLAKAHPKTSGHMFPKLAADIAATGRSTFDGSLAQQLSGAVGSSHSHLSLKAKPKKHRSRMPRPPKHVGLQTVVHATLQLPPDVESLPAQRNARRRLSIWPIAQEEKQQAMLIWIGIANNVTLISRTRPA
jgi:hypothetical protein